MSKQAYWQFPFMCIFAVIFSALGYFLPLTYRQYFDKTEYIRFIQPVEVEKETYRPCTMVRLSTKATAILPLQSHTVAVLEKLEEDGVVRVTSYDFDSEFGIMDNTKISKDFSLPCELDSGKYFFTAVLKYNLDRAERAYPWYSETFEVVK